MPEIINKQVVSVGFGFFHDEEIKKLSVKQITNAYSFDNLRQPVRGGFYDSAMGPIDFHESCPTCGTNEKECPGHSGHIQLAVPVYNLFLFDILYKLLHLKCWNCHHFKMNVLKKKSVLAQLLYIESGNILKAKEVEELGTSTSVKAVVDDGKYNLEEKLDEHIQKGQKLLSKANAMNTKLTFHAANIRGKLIRSFFSGPKAPKCSHCNAISPTYRRDGHTKIFVNALSTAAETHNISQSVRLISVMSVKDGVSNDFEQEVDVSKVKSKSEQKKTHNKKRSGNDSDSDDSDDEFDEEINESDIEESLEALNTAKDHIKVDALVGAVHEKTSRLMLPNEVERHMQLLWLEEYDLLSRLFAPQTRHLIASVPYNGADYKAFFHRVLLVPPPRYRQPSVVGGEVFENEINVAYRKIFEFNENIVSIVRGVDSNDKKNVTSGVSQEAESRIDTLTSNHRSQVVQNWMAMQQQINVLFDSDKTGSALQKASGNGLRQILEKKEGLFRKNMMGKRVNFAARSVISPDPYLHTREIGVPDVFAKTLTYPQPVTSWNVEELRQAVINGPNVHPGANAVVDGRGKVTSLERLDQAKRIAIANTLMAENLYDNTNRRSDDVCGVEKNMKSSVVGDAGPKVVLRHLKSGDVLLVNRQPTLHKPSMTAHVARVLFGETVLRMHYANCNQYNADFDGDEINLHFPQNELARVEAYDIANNDSQYIVPTSGNPLRGLIQDHVVCGVRLTQRDCFMNQEYFQQFFYLGVADKDISLAAPIETPVPCILKPQPLWSGKQVISSVIKYVTVGKPPINLNPVKAKVPGSAWGKAGEEDGYVVVRDNELVQGVIDKAQFGASKFGLVHAIYELYGTTAAANLLTIFARLFTRVLQYDGFTCGIEDMLLIPDAERRRRQLINDSVLVGVKAAAGTAGIKEADDRDLVETNIVHKAIQRFFRENKNAGVVLDGSVKSVLNQCTSNIISTCLPAGQRVAFPRNNMAMMTVSGAKGSMVNFSQISCLLGQQELEGRRVPVTQAGKTLPSFPKYDPQPRAGGYITQRFLTGIKPQEYYFHCMSGREGLVDTAVKTANSGYLQRCLIKQLESLSVQYDYTVRDVDSSVVQFMYGEDSIDVLKSSYLQNMTFLAENYGPLVSKLNPVEAVKTLDCVSVETYNADLKEKIEEYETMKVTHDEETEREQKKIEDKSVNGKPRDKDVRKYKERFHQREEQMAAVNDEIKNFDPVLSVYPPGCTLGAVSENYSQTIENYCNRDPDGIFANAAKMQLKYESELNKLEAKHNQTVKELDAQNLRGDKSGIKTVQKKLNDQTNRIEKLRSLIEHTIDPAKFTYLMNMNYMWSLVPPGENVGVIAGQSVGEPSTQMTLNTFHLAGHGGANVTLGIPRLREIVMTASEKISTPIMEIPVLPGLPLDRVEHLAAKLNKIRLGECITGVEVTQRAGRLIPGSRDYVVRLELKDMKGEWAKKNLVNMYNVSKCVSTQFCQKLSTSIKMKLRKGKDGLTGHRFMQKSKGEIANDAEGVDGDDDEMLDSAARKQLRQAEEGAKESKRARKGQEMSSYDDDSEGEESESDDDDNDKEGNDSDAEEDDEHEESSELPKKKVSLKDIKEAQRVSDNIDFSTFVRSLTPLWRRHDVISEVNFNLDSNYIDITVTIPPGNVKLLMLSIVEKVADVCLVRFTKNINKAMVIERMVKGEVDRVVQTDGVNFLAVWEQPDADCSRIKCNDIHQLLKTYGVEAARNAIMQEVSGVFAVYGIAVDNRHLTLIADFMTFQGMYLAMNRNCMGSRPSVLQKATFETSMKFILDACMRGDTDDLTSPSSAIILGKPIKSGTNAFSLLQPIA